MRILVRIGLVLVAAAVTVGAATSVASASESAIQDDKIWTDNRDM